MISNELTDKFTQSNNLLQETANKAQLINFFLKSPKAIEKPSLKQRDAIAWVSEFRYKNNSTASYVISTPLSTEHGRTASKFTKTLDVPAGW